VADSRRCVVDRLFFLLSNLIFIFFIAIFVLSPFVKPIFFSISSFGTRLVRNWTSCFSQCCDLGFMTRVSDFKT